MISEAETIRRSGLSRDAVKYIAMATMFCNHFATALLPGGVLRELLLDVGYFTAVTMCYFLVEGYYYTHDKGRYGGRLLLFAAVSQLPYQLMQGFFQLNMLFTLFVCFLLLVVLERVNHPAGRVLLCAGLLLASCFMDWALLAPVYTLLFRWSGTDRRRTAVSFALAALLFGALNLASWWGTVSPALALGRAALSCAGIAAAGCVLLLAYSGRRARRGRTFSKWFFYAFYPAHLLLLGLLKLAWG